LFVDGKLITTTNAENPFELNTKDFPDGWHELRIVGRENSPIETQGRIILPVQFSNYGKTIKFNVSPQARVRAGGSIKVTAQAPGSTGIAFYQNKEVVAKFVGADGEATIEADSLGQGPVTLQAIGWGGGNVDSIVVSPPVHLSVEGNGIRNEAETAKPTSRKAKFEQ
jgi:hypothetical protein